MQSDPLWFEAALLIHIACGTAALLLVPVVLATTKGGERHRRWGKIYFWTMTILAASALAMALYRPNLFLALIAVLTFYLVFSGRRAVNRKDRSADLADWTAAAMTLAACGSLMAFALLRPDWVQHMGLVAVALGGIGVLASGSDLRRFAGGPPPRMAWLTMHLGRFLGSYIAAWTAFSAVTLSQFLPHAGLVVWLWPSALGVPAITLTAIHYQRKCADRSTVSSPP
jgi:uncharacterized membrane protein